MNPKEFKEGKVYFTCGHLHPKYPIPLIQPMVYIKKREDGFLFQPIEKYYKEDMVENLSEEERKGFTADDLLDIFYPENLIHLVKDLDEVKNFIANLDREPFAEEIF